MNRLLFTCTEQQEGVQGAELKQEGLLQEWLHPEGAAGLRFWSEGLPGVGVQEEGVQGSEQWGKGFPGVGVQEEGVRGLEQWGERFPGVGFQEEGVRGLEQWGEWFPGVGFQEEGVRGSEQWGERFPGVGFQEEGVRGSEQWGERFPGVGFQEEGVRGSEQWGEGFPGVGFQEEGVRRSEQWGEGFLGVRFQEEGVRGSEQWGEGFPEVNMWEGGLARLVPQAVVYVREHPAPEVRGEELLEEQDVWHASLRRRDVQGASVGVLESDNECRKEGWAVEDGGHPSRALSFSGSGFLVTYHLGVAECLLENMPEVVHGAPRVFGASGGSLIAAAVVCAVNLDNFYRSLKRAAKLSRRWFLGPMHPLFNLLRIVREGLVENLPENAHELASGRLFISLTRVSDGQNVLVSDFTSNEELVQALVCSCFVPVYCGLVPPTFRGVVDLADLFSEWRRIENLNEHYIDGGFTNIQPLYDVRNTITISPFSGETDICPRDSADYFLLWFSNCSFVLSPENLHRVVLALFPPHSKILQRFVWNGYSDALHYLLQNVLPTVRGQKMGIPGKFTSMATYPTRSVASVAQRVKSWFLNIPKAFGLLSKNAESRRISG